MNAWYKSHDDPTLSYTEDILTRFHAFKDVFSLGRASKTVKIKANALSTEIVKKWKIDEETNDDTSALSHKRHEMKAWRDTIRHVIDVSIMIDDNFNIRKIHLMTYWVEQIGRYGALPQRSAQRHAQAHKMYWKDSWIASNYKLNDLWRVMTIQHRILSFEVTVLNLQALAQSREIIAAGCQVLPSSPDQAAPLRPPSYVKPKFMGPHNRYNGKHSDAIINIIRALFHNTQDAMHCMAICSGTWECMNHKFHIKTYISDELPHATELCIYDSILHHVERFEGEAISQMSRCRGSQSWHGRDQQNDKVWAK